MLRRISCLYHQVFGGDVFRTRSRIDKQFGRFRIREEKIKLEKDHVNELRGRIRNIRLELESLRWYQINKIVSQGMQCLKLEIEQKISKGKKDQLCAAIDKKKFFEGKGFNSMLKFHKTKKKDLKRCFEGITNKDQSLLDYFKSWFDLDAWWEWYQKMYVNMKLKNADLILKKIEEKKEVINVANDIFERFRELGIILSEVDKVIKELESKEEPIGEVFKNNARNKFLEFIGNQTISKVIGKILPEDCVDELQYDYAKGQFVLILEHELRGSFSNIGVDGWKIANGCSVKAAQKIKGEISKVGIRFYGSSFSVRRFGVTLANLDKISTTILNGELKIITGLDVLWEKSQFFATLDGLRWRNY